jgi:hypothetical protein
MLNGLHIWVLTQKYGGVVTMQLFFQINLGQTRMSGLNKKYSLAKSNNNITFAAILRHSKTLGVYGIHFGFFGCVAV